MIYLSICSGRLVICIKTFSGFEDKSDVSIFQKFRLSPKNNIIAIQTATIPNRTGTVFFDFLYFLIIVLSSNPVLILYRVCFSIIFLILVYLHHQKLLESIYFQNS